MLILVFLVNVITAVLTFISLIGYAIIYTMYLKRATPQNIVIGGAAGAAPPVLGWTAVTGYSDHRTSGTVSNFRIGSGQKSWYPVCISGRQGTVFYTPGWPC